MGGEHQIHFHGHRECTGWIPHWNRHDVPVTAADIQMWTQLKPKILAFIRKYEAITQMEAIRAKQYEVYRYSRQMHWFESVIRQVEAAVNVQDISVSWTEKVCCGHLGPVMHDVFHLLMLSFPGKMCGVIERCFHAGLTNTGIEAWDEPQFFTYLTQTNYEFEVYRHEDFADV